MRRAAAVAFLAAGLAAGDGLASTPRAVLLLSAETRLTAEPPLLPDVRLQETRWRGRIRSAERVAVGIDTSGRPVAVRVVQRLVVGGKGDYVFAVAAPVKDVRAGAGSESEPGLRTDLVLWQGFSAGGRVLVADATLDPRRTEATLPLRVRLDRSGGSLSLTVENATSVQATAATGVGEPAQLRRILAGAAALRPGEQVYARLSGETGGRNVRVEAPFRLRGALAFSPGALAHATASGGRIVGDEVRFAGVVGGGSPLRLVVRVRGAQGEPRVRLRAVPEIPRSLLSAPTGLDAEQLLARTTETLLRSARVAQYRTYLENPDSRGSSSAVYEYRTAPTAAAAPAPARDDSGGPWGTLLIAIGLTVGAGLAVVAWAHS